jgi:hypothetical protein
MYTQLATMLLCTVIMCAGWPVSFDDIEPQAANVKDTFDMSQLSDDDRALIRHFDRELTFCKSRFICQITN